MSHQRASLARLASEGSSSSLNSAEQKLTTYERTLQAILGPSRLASLASFDADPIPYNTYSYFSYIYVLRGRNLPMMIMPLITLFFWGLGWQLLFHYGVKSEIIYQGVTDLQDYLSSMEELVIPLLTPLSFMLTFRLGRAAVRFWEARAAAGKMVEICRSNVATVCAGFLSPIRLRKRHMQKQQQQREKENVQPCNMEEEEEAIELLCEYARWLTVFPVAVKHFLRPVSRPGWDAGTRFKKRRYEIGPLLSDKDAELVIMEYDDRDGKPTDDTSATRARDPPLVVLNRLHELAYDIAHFAYNTDSDSFSPTPQGRAVFYEQITEQINILFGAYGAMERIKGVSVFIYHDLCMK